MATPTQQTDSFWYSRGLSWTREGKGILRQRSESESRAVLFDSGIPWTVAHQAPLLVGFSRQEYQRRLPFPSPGDPPNPGIKTTSPALAGGFFTVWASREAHCPIIYEAARRRAGGCVCAVNQRHIKTKLKKERPHPCSSKGAGRRIEL